jgi:hypothetical protein
MHDLPLISQITLYALLGLIALFALILFWWQIQVLRGKRMENPDGSFDDWHEQKVHFGHAIADIFFACPVSIATVGLILLGSNWGFFLLPMIGFWFVYSNTFTTATSLRFEKPKMTLMWFLVFPLGIMVGIAVLAWTIFHFRMLFWF